MKICPRCGETLPLNNFYFVSKEQNKRYTYCKKCTNLYNKLRREKLHLNPEYRQRDLDKKSENHYKRRHNLTKEDRDLYIAEQGSICGICGTDDPGKRGWQLDHDHSCCPPEFSCSSCRRGILCVRCNTAIGLFNDSYEFVSNALRYLSKQ
jgi:hypothetical protein